MSIQELKTKDPKYSDWISENMLVINWILNSMEKELQAVSNIVEEFWESIEAAYVQKEIMHEYSSWKKKLQHLANGTYLMETIVQSLEPFGMSWNYTWVLNPIAQRNRLSC